MSFTRSKYLPTIQDIHREDDLIVIKKKNKKNKRKGRGNENSSMVRRTQKSSRPSVEPTPTTRTANRNVFGTGSSD